MLFALGVGGVLEVQAACSVVALAPRCLRRGSHPRVFGHAGRGKGAPSKYGPGIAGDDRTCTPNAPQGLSKAGAP